MKKFVSVFLVLALCLSLVACGGGQDNAVNITIEDVTAAIQTVDSEFSFDEDKPMFEMIGAKDGWMGYLNGTSPIKVYQFENESTYKKAVDTYGNLISAMPKVGNFVLECSNDDVRQAFENIGSHAEK